MSEYQYYEFRAIDHPLTEAQKDKVAALSSRAQVTSHVASFVYNYGDFRGDPEQLLSDYFDAMLYMANWGSRQLMFRIPRALIDSQHVGQYCVSEAIDRRMTKNKQYVIVDIDFHDEEQADWTEGEGWLDDLVGLREELIHGDFRMLYLAWLKAADGAVAMAEIAADSLEPPVPDGLGQLSPALMTFVRFLDIDAAMIAVAAQNSRKQLEAPSQLDTWIAKLPEAERHDFLVRLSRGEKNMSILLNRRLQQLATAAQPRTSDAVLERRSISALLETAEGWRQQKKAREQRQATLAQQRKLEALVPREPEVWEEVESLVAEKKATSYDRAVGLLKDLRDLAHYRQDIESFRTRIVAMAHTYANRSALLRRLQDSQLIQ